MPQQPIDLILSEARLLRIVVKGKLKVSELFECAHLCLDQFVVNIGHTVLVCWLLTIFVVDDDQLFEVGSA